MSKNEIAAMIKRVADIGDVLNHLLKIPQKQIEKALQLLSDPEAVSTMRRLLQTVHEIQSGIGTSSRRKVGAQSVQRRLYDDISVDDLDSAFVALFSDRKQFPTVHSIRDFAKKVFGVHVPYNKTGRDRFVRNLVKKVVNNPKAIKYARNVLAHRQITKKDEAYSLLYKFIRGRLSE